MKEEASTGPRLTSRPALAKAAQPTHASTKANVHAAANGRHSHQSALNLDDVSMDDSDSAEEDHDDVSNDSSDDAEAVAAFSEDESAGDESDEVSSGDEEVQRRLAAYERSRLRYFYAVVQCADVPTAAHLYSECDGLEFERSANK